jgi:hypothetical protein
MSIAILISVHDGLVLAADSASTLTLQPPPGIAVPGGTLVANVYDNANKIFNLVKGKPLGCVTFGSGSIGNASVGTLIKDFRKKLTDRDLDFDPEKYSMQSVATLLANFLDEECKKLNTAASQNTTLGLLVGGYPSSGSLGESWSVEIVQGNAKQPVKLRNDEDPGISWGGMTEVVQRIVLGFSPNIFSVLAEVSEPKQNAQTMSQNLSQLLLARLQAPIIFAPMPIQDAIDLSRFLVHSAIMFSRFMPGPQMVGGLIEIAAITKHEGFKWVSRKHYYNQETNQEPIHVIVDKSGKN